MCEAWRRRLISPWGDQRMHALEKHLISSDEPEAEPVSVIMIDICENRPQASSYHIGTDSNICV